jgi:hypothetical protein
LPFDHIVGCFFSAANVYSGKTVTGGSAIKKSPGHHRPFPHPAAVRIPLVYDVFNKVLENGVCLAAFIINSLGITILPGYNLTNRFSCPTHKKADMQSLSKKSESVNYGKTFEVTYVTWGRVAPLLQSLKRRKVHKNTYSYCIFVDISS